MLQRWRQLIARGGETAVAANEDVVPASELRAAQQQIRELERLIGKRAVDLEILRAARPWQLRLSARHGAAQPGVRSGLQPEALAATDAPCRVRPVRAREAGRAPAVTQ